VAGVVLATGETKAAFRQRLEALNRWRDFVSLREARKNELINKFNWERQRAAQDAWVEISALFPLTIGVKDTPSGPLPETLADKAARTSPAALRKVLAQDDPSLEEVQQCAPNILTDMAWVYANLDKTLDPLVYPNGGAKALWGWATKNEEEFFKQYLNLSSKAAAKDEKKKEDDKVVDGLIDRLLQAYPEGSARESGVAEVAPQ
jgi:hypothetical protein